MYGTGIASQRVVEIWEVCASTPLQHTVIHNTLHCVGSQRRLCVPSEKDNSILISEGNSCHLGRQLCIFKINKKENMQVVSLSVH